MNIDNPISDLDGNFNHFNMVSESEIFFKDFIIFYTIFIWEKMYYFQFGNMTKEKKQTMLIVFT